MPGRAVAVMRSPSIAVIQGPYEQFCTSPLIADAKAQDFPFLDSIDYFVIWAQVAQVALATDPPTSEWIEFQRLVGEWRAQRGVMSSITESVLCPAYQSIIGMGRVAIPFLVAQLESEGADPDQWFWALTAITGANPVRDADRGNYERMAQSWREWAGQPYGYAR